MSGRRDGHVFDAGPTVITDPDCLQGIVGADRRRPGERCRAGAGDALLPAELARRHASSIIRNDDAALDAPDRGARIPPTSPAIAASSLIPAGVFGEGYREARRGAVPRFQRDDARRAGAGPLPGVALGLCDGLALRAQRETAPGVVLPHPARRRQSDDDQRDLRPDPQAGARRRRLVRRAAAPTRWSRGMARHFERLGGTIRLGDPVEAIETRRSARDRRADPRRLAARAFDAVASNGDVVHSYDLLGTTARPPHGREASRRKRFSPSLFVVHFGTEGDWPDIPHHSILFGPRYQGLLDDIYERGVLPDGFVALSPPSDRHRSGAWRRRAARPSTRWRRCRISASCRSIGREDGAALSRRDPRLSRAAADAGPQRPDHTSLPLHARPISRPISAPISARRSASSRC